MQDEEIKTIKEEMLQPKSKSNFYLERLGVGPRCYRLLKGENRIGRISSYCNISIESTYCSRIHSKIIVGNNYVRIIDTSSNGTYINNEILLNKGRMIELGTKIGFGVVNVEDELAVNENLCIVILKSIEPDENIEPDEIIELSSDEEIEHQSFSKLAVQIFGEQIMPDLVDANKKIEPTSQTEIIDEQPICDNTLNLNEDEECLKNSEMYLKEIKEEINDDYLEKSLKDIDEGRTSWSNKLSQHVVNKIMDEIIELSSDEEIEHQSFSKLAVQIFGEQIMPDLVDANKKIEPTSQTEIIDEQAICDNTLNLNEDEECLKNSEMYLKEIKEEINDYDYPEKSLKDIDEGRTSWSNKLSQHVVNKIMDLIGENYRDKPSCSKTIQRSFNVGTNGDFEINDHLLDEEMDDNLNVNNKKRHLSNTAKQSSVRIIPAAALKRKKSIAKVQDIVSTEQIDNLKRKVQNCAKSQKLSKEMSQIYRRSQKLRFSTIPKKVDVPYLRASNSHELNLNNLDSNDHNDTNNMDSNDRNNMDSNNVKLNNLESNSLNKKTKIVSELIKKPKAYEASNAYVASNGLNHTILNEILSWEYKWLKQDQKTICNNWTLQPMLHQYDNFQTYKNIIYPLMSLEFFVRLQQEKQNKFKKFTIINFKRTQNNVSDTRIMYHFQKKILESSDKNLFFASDLVAIEITEAYKVLGFVRNVYYFEQSSLPYFEIEVESKWSQHLYEKVKLIYERNITIKVIKLSQIRMELGAFDAIDKLKESPLLNMILNPFNIKHNNINIKEIQYCGYEKFKLNDEQKRILLETYARCIYANKPIIQLIEGPPGTGKTRLIINLILQFLYGDQSSNQKYKLLICANSNNVVDIIALKLIYIRNKMDERKRFELIRFGNKERMHPDVRIFSLEEQIKLRRSLKEPAIKKEEEFLKSRIEQKKKTNLNGINDSDIENYSNQLNRLIEIDNKEPWKNAQVICCTVSSCVSLKHFISKFDICIIDDAPQCSEPWTLLPIQFGIKSLILTGDPNQVPVTCISSFANDYNYGKALFTRIIETLEVDSKVPKLLQQHRMHSEIALFPNKYFYKNAIETDDQITVPEIKPYSVINLKENDQKIDNMEINFVIKLIEYLNKIFDKTITYGIITPYYFKCSEIINKKLKEIDIENLNIEIHGVDAFQGRGKDIIIIMYNKADGIGFLRNETKLNISLTRAQKCLILCGDVQKLAPIKIWRLLINDAKARSVYYDFDYNNVIGNFEESVMSKMLLPKLPN